MSSILFHGLALFAARRFFARSTTIQLSKQPSVTLLKPVAGIDADAYRNFTSFCEQEYADYQIIFGVTDANDPAIAIIQQIIADYPHIDIQLAISPRGTALNPKIGNLIGMQPYIKHELILISDSDIFVDKDYLTLMVAPMIEDTSITAVTSIYRSSGQGFFNALESIETATDYIPGILTSTFLTGPQWTLGCSVLLAQSTLASIGGLAAIQHHIGEDCLLGKLLIDRGHRIALARCIINHNLHPGHFLDYVRRKNRWNKGILTYYKAAYCGCIFMFAPVICGLLLTVMTPDETSTLMMLTLGGWLTRCIMGWIIGVYYLKDQHTKRFFALLPVYDVLNVVLWCYGFFSKKVFWRNTYFKIQKEGLLRPLNSPQ